MFTYCEINSNTAYLKLRHLLTRKRIFFLKSPKQSSSTSMLVWSIFRTSELNSTSVHFGLNDTASLYSPTAPVEGFPSD